MKNIFGIATLLMFSVSCEDNQGATESAPAAAVTEGVVDEVLPDGTTQEGTGPGNQGSEIGADNAGNAIDGIIPGFGNLTGTLMIDGSDGDVPAAGAKVFVQSRPELETTADEDGQFSMANVQPGSLTIYAEGQLANGPFSKSQSRTV